MRVMTFGFELSLASKTSSFRNLSRSEEVDSLSFFTATGIPWYSPFNTTLSVPSEICLPRFKSQTERLNGTTDLDPTSFACSGRRRLHQVKRSKRKAPVQTSAILPEHINACISSSASLTSI
jgi:hypothetical protein